LVKCTDNNNIGIGTVSHLGRWSTTRTCWRCFGWCRTKMWL